MSILSLFSRSVSQRREETEKNLIACSWIALCLSTVVLLTVTVLQVVLVFNNILPYEVQILIMFFSTLFHFFMTVFITLLVLSKLRNKKSSENQNLQLEPQSRSNQEYSTEQFHNSQRGHNLQLVRNISGPPPYANQLRTYECNECKSASNQTTNLGHKDINHIYSEPKMYNLRKEIPFKSTESSDSFTNISQHNAVQCTKRQLDSLQSDVNSESSSDQEIKTFWESSNENELREATESLMRRIEELKNKPRNMSSRESIYANLPYALKNMYNKPENGYESDSIRQDFENSDANLCARSGHGYLKQRSPTISTKSGLPETRKLARAEKECISSESINSFSQSMGFGSRLNKNEQLFHPEDKLSKLTDGLNLAAKPIVRKAHSIESTLHSGKSAPNLNSESFSDNVTRTELGQGDHVRSIENGELRSSLRNSNLRKSDAALFQGRSQIHQMNQKILEQYASKTRLSVRNSLHSSLEDKTSPMRLSSIQESIENSHELPKNTIRF